MTAFIYYLSNKKPTIQLSKTVFCLFFIMLCLVLSSGCGGKKDSADTQNSGASTADQSPSEEELQKQKEEEERLQKMKELAKKRFEEALANEPKFDYDATVKKMVLAKMKIDLDKISRKLTKKEVDKLIKQKAKEKAEIMYPKEKREKVIKESENEYRLYKPNDEVTVTTRRGPVSGLLEKIFHDKIKLGKFYILKNDILSPDPACFDEAKCEKMRRHYVRINFDIEKKDYTKAVQKKLAPNVYKENGFVRKGKKWVKIDKIIKAKFDPEIKKQEEEYNKALEERIKAEVQEKMKEEGLLP